LKRRERRAPYDFAAELQKCGDDIFENALRVASLSGPLKNVSFQQETK
jgi:hypothetical protein